MVQNIKKVTCFVLLLSTIILISGCLETPEATPATIDENALSAYGWSQVSVEERTFEQEITDTKTLTISSATVEYSNDRLINDIKTQAIQFTEDYNIPVPIDVPSGMTAHIITYRISLPSGATLPTELVSEIRDKMLTDLKEGNDLENIQETTTRTIVLNDGTEAVVKIFTGKGNSTDTGLRMMGFITAFENEDTNTFVMGFVPDGEHRIESGILNATLFSIDGESEIDEMLELVKTIE